MTSAITITPEQDLKKFEMAVHGVYRMLFYGVFVLVLLLKEGLAAEQCPPPAPCACTCNCNHVDDGQGCDGNDCNLEEIRKEIQTLRSMNTCENQDSIREEEREEGPSNPVFPEDQPGCQDNTIDLIFVIDESGSVRDNNPRDHSYDNWNLLLRFISDIVDRFDIGQDRTRVGMVTFANYAFNTFYLNDYTRKEYLIDAIMNTPYEGGNTNTSGGLRRMHSEQFRPENGDRPPVPNVAVLITDEGSTWDVQKTIPEADAAKAKDITIYAVGISDVVNVDELQQISSWPQQEGRTYWLLDNFLSLDGTVEDVVSAICSP